MIQQRYQLVIMLDKVLHLIISYPLLKNTTLLAKYQSNFIACIFK